MRPRLALVAAGVGGNGAVGSRVGAFARGLDQRGWDITLIDPAPSSATVADRLFAHLPLALRSMLERAGIEGDIRPAAGWRAWHELRAVATDVVIVSVPPFSLLGTTVAALDPRVPLVVDYRDPWSARHHPPPLARMTRTIERYALRRAAAVVYAGGPVLGDLLIQHLRLAPDKVMSISNGFEPADAAHLHAVPVRPERNGAPLDLVMSGYWYARNGPKSRRVRFPRSRLVLVGGGVGVLVVAAITTAASGAFTTTPNAAPAPAPTAVPAPLTGLAVPASPSATPAPLTSFAAPVPAPAIYASGTVDDLGTKEGIDLDTGQRLDQNAPGVDISFSSTSTHMDAMDPGVYYQVLPQPATQPEKRMCDVPAGWAREYKYVHDLTEGRTNCVKTDEGRLSMMTITKRATNATGTISLRYVTWL